MKDIPVELIIRKINTTLTPQQERLFNQWLNENPENVKVYNDFLSVWFLLQRKVMVAPRPAVADCKKRVMEHIGRQSGPDRDIHSKMKRIIMRISAAASILLLVTGIYLGGKHACNYDDSILAESVCYEAGDSVLRVILPDSSKVWLNKNSSLRYSFDKRDKTRMVQLQGEAGFDVMKRNKSMFSVFVDNARINVYGTVFNVNGTENEVVVALKEGSVSLTAGGLDVMLKPGECAVYDARISSITKNHMDTDLMLCWTGEKLCFEQESLRHICKFLEKRYGVSIQVGTKVPDDYLFTLTVQDEPIADILYNMSLVNEFKYTVEDDRIYIHN